MDKQCLKKKKKDKKPPPRLCRCEHAKETQAHPD